MIAAMQIQTIEARGGSHPGDVSLISRLEELGGLLKDLAP